MQSQSVSVAGTELCSGGDTQSSSVAGAGTEFCSGGDSSMAGTESCYGGNTQSSTVAGTESCSGGDTQSMAGTESCSGGDTQSSSVAGTEFCSGGDTQSFSSPVRFVEAAELPSWMISDLKLKLSPPAFDIERSTSSPATAAMVSPMTPQQSAPSVPPALFAQDAGDGGPRSSVGANRRRRRPAPKPSPRAPAVADASENAAAVGGGFDANARPVKCPAPPCTASAVGKAPRVPKAPKAQARKVRKAPKVPKMARDLKSPKDAKKNLTAYHVFLRGVKDGSVVLNGTSKTDMWNQLSTVEKEKYATVATTSMKKAKTKKRGGPKKKVEIVRPLVHWVHNPVVREHWVLERPPTSTNSHTRISRH